MAEPNTQHVIVARWAFLFIRFYHDFAILRRAYAAEWIDSTQDNIADGHEGSNTPPPGGVA